MGEIEKGAIEVNDKDLGIRSAFRKDVTEGDLRSPTVMDTVQHVIAMLSNEGIAVPGWLYGHRYWHELVYELHKMPDAPKYLKEESFDFIDDPYPTSAKATESLLPTMSLVCADVGNGMKKMISGIVELQLEELSYTPKEYRDFVDKAVILAKAKLLQSYSEAQIKII